MQPQPVLSGFSTGPSISWLLYMLGCTVPVWKSYNWIQFAFFFLLGVWLSLKKQNKVKQNKLYIASIIPGVPANWTAQFFVFFPKLTASQVERKWCTIFCSSKHVQKRTIDSEATQCSWQTLWLHAEYRVYTSHATELVWPLLLPSANDDQWSIAPWLSLGSLFMLHFTLACERSYRYTAQKEGERGSLDSSLLSCMRINLHIIWL